MRDPATEHRNACIAALLWLVWAILLWNVVADHVIVVAGREYIAAAERAWLHATYARMDDWMRPAVGRAVMIATAAAAPILTGGLLLARAALRNSRPEKSCV